MATNPKAKKIIIWSSVAVVLGVGGYFLYQYFKKKKAGSTGDETPIPTPELNPSVNPVAPSGNPDVASDKPTSKEDIKAFQDYVLNVKKDTAILGKSGADGVWGSNSQKAWDKYGADFKKSATPANDKELERAFNLILAKASNDKGKATRSYLEKASPSFVKKWAKMIDDKKTIFTWSGKTWRTKTGEKMLDYDPIGMALKTNANGIYAYEWADKKSAKVGIAGNQNVGKVRSITFDGDTIWFYLPDGGGNYKWGKSTDFKKA
jgi:hypothetical protein